MPPFRSYCFSVFISLKFSVRCFVEYKRLYQFPLSLSLHCKYLLFRAAFFLSSYVLLLFSLFFFPFFSLFSILASRSFLPSYMKECHKWYTVCGCICGADLEFFQLSFHTITQMPTISPTIEVYYIYMNRCCNEMVVNDDALFPFCVFFFIFASHFIVVITPNTVLHSLCCCRLSSLVARYTELSNGIHQYFIIWRWWNWHLQVQYDFQQ